jgi:hypothetical protein
MILPTPAPTAEPSFRHPQVSEDHRLLQPRHPRRRDRTRPPTSTSRRICPHPEQGGRYRPHRLTITPGPPSRNSTTGGTSSVCTRSRTQIAFARLRYALTESGGPEAASAAAVVAKRTSTTTRTTQCARTTTEAYTRKRPLENVFGRRGVSTLRFAPGHEAHRA